MASRALFLAAFTVLLARALLPGAVMLDPVSAAQGGFALVMCSGHGPMFAQGAAMMDMPGMAASMPGMNMSHMAGMTAHGMEMSGASGATGHGSMAGDDGLCPFSAALVVACVGVALACVLFVLIRAAQSWITVVAQSLSRSPLHFQPPSRAPPRFS